MLEGFGGGLLSELLKKFCEEFFKIIIFLIVIDEFKDIIVFSVDFVFCFVLVLDINFSSLVFVIWKCILCVFVDYLFVNEILILFEVFNVYIYIVYRYIEEYVMKYESEGEYELDI